MAAKQVTRPAPRRGKLRPFKQAVVERGLVYTTARDRALAGELRYIRIGTAWYTTDADIDEFIDRGYAETAGR